VLQLVLSQPRLCGQQQVDRETLLGMSMAELMNVEVVTGSKVLQEVNDVPATIRVITASEIHDRGYFTIDEALADLPGLQFRNMLSVNSYVFQRGAPSQNNLILMLVDGIPINELNSGGFYGGGQYNLSNVERIEVMYGPAAAMYGTNAMSGIINIITKDAASRRGLDLTALYGSFNTAGLDVGYGHRDGRHDLGLRVAGMYKTSDKADVGGVAGDNNWTESLELFERDYSLEAKVSYGAFTGGFVAQEKHSSAGTYNRSVGTIYRDSGTTWNVRFVNGHVRHTYERSPRWSLQTTLYYRNATVLDNSVMAIVDTAQIGYYRPNDLFGLESTVRLEPIGAVAIVGGAVAEIENLAERYANTWSGSPEEKPPKPPRPPMAQNHLVSTYLQTRISMAGSLQVTAGARFDHSSVYDQVLTPRVGLIYRRGQFTAKLLYLDAFRAPRPWDYTWGIGNPELQPERMASIEAALGHSLTGRLYAEVSLYRNRLTDMLSKDAPLERWINSGTLTTKGVELGLHYMTQPLTWNVNYTFSDSRDQAAEPIPEISRHGANAGILYAITDHLKLDLRGNYIGGRKNPSVIPATGTTHIAPALVVNAVATFTSLRGLDVQLIGKNIFNAEYYHTSNRSVTRWRQPQRTVLLRATWHVGSE
jgi:iron complex outermembrane receptor protein